MACIESTNAQIVDIFGHSVVPEFAEEYVCAVRKTIDQFAKEMEMKLKQEVAQLFSINHRLIMIKKWTTANHIRSAVTNCCEICYVSPVDTFLKDCGHTGCNECLNKVTFCPFCRGPVDLRKMFFSDMQVEEQPVEEPQVYTRRFHIEVQEPHWIVVFSRAFCDLIKLTSPVP